MSPFASPLQHLSTSTKDEHTLSIAPQLICTFEYKCGGRAAARARPPACARAARRPGQLHLGRLLVLLVAAQEAEHGAALVGAPILVVLAAALAAVPAGSAVEGGGSARSAGSR